MKQEPEKLTIKMGEGEHKAIETKDHSFARQYAVSGWFKWQVPEKMQRYHGMFRMTSTDKETNKNTKNLGDQTLGAWLGSTGEYALATYTYTDLNGNGNANSAKVVKHDGSHTVWNFVYFGYSR